jgi:hypothetical protein
MLQLTRVGVLIAHPAREYVFAVSELLLAAKEHAAALEAAPEEAKRFVLMKARPVLETEHDIEGVATVEAYQVTDQSIELAMRDAFSESKTDPRVAKTKADCYFIVEKKEQRKVTTSHTPSRTTATMLPAALPLAPQRLRPRVTPCGACPSTSGDGGALCRACLRRRSFAGRLALRLLPLVRLCRREPADRAAGRQRDGELLARPPLQGRALHPHRCRPAVRHHPPAKRATSAPCH